MILISNSAPGNSSALVHRDRLNHLARLRGTTRVRPVWNGRANCSNSKPMVRRATSKRCRCAYNPESHQWSINLPTAGRHAGHPLDRRVQPWARRIL